LAVCNNKGRYLILGGNYQLYKKKPSITDFDFSVLALCKARFTLGVRDQKNLGPTLSIFGLQIGFPNWMVSFIQPWGQYKAIKLGQIEKFLFISALTPSVKPLGLISTFAPIGMLDLG
jgi:hypothetical protein